MNIDRLNTTTLAFMGDAVYEVYVRRAMIETGSSRADKLHRMTVRYVRAAAQAQAVRTLYDELMPDEKNLVRRARNRRSAARARHTDPLTYKYATAFEALIGYLYLIEDTARMEEIIAAAMRVIREGEQEDGEEESPQ